MAAETDEFILADVAWNYVQSKEITADRMPPAAVKSGLSSALVICKGCDHTWMARPNGAGNFHQVLGGILITCPSCKVSARVANEALI